MLKDFNSGKERTYIISPIYTESTFSFACESVKLYKKTKQLHKPIINWQAVITQMIARIETAINILEAKLR